MTYLSIFSHLKIKFYQITRGRQLKRLLQEMQISLDTFLKNYGLSYFLATKKIRKQRLAFL